MIRLAVIRAPTQWEMSMTSCTEQPGKKYLLPPEKPTTSWGNTGPTIRFTSDSTHSLLICTRMGVSASRPPVSSLMRSAGISPRSAIWSGSSQAWLTISQPGYAAARPWPSAPISFSMWGSDMAAWVPRAISTVTEAARPASAAWIGFSTRGRGTERVPSGMIRHTLLPSRSWPASCWATNSRICCSVSTPSGPPSSAARSARPSGMGWMVGICGGVGVWLIPPVCDGDRAATSTGGGLPWRGAVARDERRHA